MRTVSILLIALAFGSGAAAVPPDAFNVTAFGAKGDGKAVDTAALQQAIDAAAGAGGGTVYFPVGRFLSGTLTLKSNVTLELSPGAVLLGSTRKEDYPMKHLLYADGAQNIAIEGGGAIDGQGDAFFDAKMNPAEYRPSPLIELWNVRGLRMEGVTIRNAPAWTVHPKNCEDVKIRGISILNNLRAVNSDGIDVDSSRNVIISDCHIEAGDDCIVLKTTSRGDGEVKPTENVVVTNCVLVSAATALKLGTESHADFRHIVFSNCVVRNSRSGIGLFTVDGATMEDVRFEQIVMTTAPKWEQGLEWPILFDIGRREPTSRLGHIRDVSFSDIAIYSKGRVTVIGMPESLLENLSFRHVTLRETGYEDISHAKKMRGRAKAQPDGTPEYGPTPSAMIFAYVKGLTLDDVTVSWPTTTTPVPSRHAIYGDHLEDVRVANFRGTGSVADAKPLVFEHSSGVEGK